MSMAGQQQGVEALVAALIDPETRENALLDLSKKRDQFADLAPILWHSFGVIPALLQEIVSIYPLLSPPSLTAHASNRVCNALALLQCVASHPDTRALFLNGACGRECNAALARHAHTLLRTAHIPLFLYPFLNTVSKTRPFEYLRLTSLGVIGALVKARLHARAHAQSAHISCLGGRHGRDQLPAVHGDHTAVPAHHGDGLGALQNGGHLHRAEDPPRRRACRPVAPLWLRAERYACPPGWFELHLRYGRAMLCRRRRAGQHGADAGACSCARRVLPCAR